jgi:hypothetical protein
MPSIVGIIPYAGIDLAVYSMLKEKYQQKYPGDKPSSALLLGWVQLMIQTLSNSKGVVL